MRRHEKTPRQRQRGFTVVELLVAMAIAGILIAFIFAVYTRMSVAYRAQNRITSVVQNLRAGHDKLIRELRMVGDQLPPPDYRPVELVAGDPFFAPDQGLPQTATMHVGTVTYNGVKVSSAINGGEPLRPIYVDNGATSREPDIIRFYWADRGTAAKVQDITIAAGATDLVLFDHGTGTNPTDQFEVGDLVVVVNTEEVDISVDVTGTTAVETFGVTMYEACLLEITSKNAPSLTLSFADAGSPFNESVVVPFVGSHCTDVEAQHDADIARPAAPRADTMVYKFEGRSYRIDTARRDVGVLQVHPDGELTAAPWTDLGIGFTNLQVASRYFENQDGNDHDGVAEPLPGTLDWYNDNQQEHPDPGGDRPDYAVMIEMTVSLETRSFAEVDTPTTSIAGYTDITVGDSPGISSLPFTSDPRYDGDFVYRWTTMNFEFRNMGRAR